MGALKLPLYLYLNCLKTKMNCILVFFNYHTHSHLFGCVPLLWAFALQVGSKCKLLCDYTCVPAKCHDMWWHTIFLSFLPFIYHVYFYSQSHDWQPFFSHMTHLESYLTFSCDSSSYDSRQLRLTHSDSLMFHLYLVSLISVLSLFHDSHKNIHCSRYLLF